LEPVEERDTAKGGINYVVERQRKRDERRNDEQNEVANQAG